MVPCTTCGKPATKPVQVEGETFCQDSCARRKYPYHERSKGVIAKWAPGKLLFGPSVPSLEDPSLAFSLELTPEQEKKVKAYMGELSYGSDE